jgi:glucosamine-phosphate N-acetyltransferase
MADTRILVRDTRETDMSEVIELLQSLSEFNPPKKDYPNIWREFCAQDNVHSLVAIIGGRIIGYGSVLIETKIRGGKLGHIEDIVSHPNYREKGIGNAIVTSLFDIAKTKGCYKVALQCKEHNVMFYTKCDYERSGVAMQRFV